MLKFILTAFGFFVTAISFGQLLQTKHYKNNLTKREVAKGKAKFVETTVRNLDGSITTEVKQIKTGEIIHSQTYTGKEPTGVWKYKYKSFRDGLIHIDDLDYTFDLDYSDNPCDDSITGVKNYWEDNDSLKYKAPKLLGGYKSITDFLLVHIIYPDEARDENIQGKVLMRLKIDTHGIIEEIVVKKGVHILLDKESVRIMRMLKLASPPMFNGKPMAVCFTMPIAYSLE